MNLFKYLGEQEILEDCLDFLLKEMKCVFENVNKIGQKLIKKKFVNKKKQETTQRWGWDDAFVWGVCGKGEKKMGKEQVESIMFKWKSTMAGWLDEVRN